MFVAISHDLAILPLMAWFILTIYFAAAMVALGYSFWVWCPTAIDEDGISKIFFGRTSALLWKDIVNIEKINFYYRPTEKYRFKISIKSSKKTISFDDYISGLSELIEFVNRKIEQYKIPTFDIDRGDETRKAPIVLLTAVARGETLGGARKPTAKI